MKNIIQNIKSLRIGKNRIVKKKQTSPTPNCKASSTFWTSSTLFVDLHHLPVAVKIVVKFKLVTSVSLNAALAVVVYGVQAHLSCKCVGKEGKSTL